MLVQKRPYRGLEGFPQYSDFLAARASNTPSEEATSLTNTGDVLAIQPSVMPNIRLIPPDMIIRMFLWAKLLLFHL